MTTPQNNVDALNRNQTRVQLPVTTNLTVNEGDLVYWDTSGGGGASNDTVTPAVASSLNNNFLGMALQSNAQQIYPGDPDQVGVLVLVRGVVWMNTTASETYSWFTQVTVGADPQTITVSGVTAAKAIGYTIPTPATSPRPQQATPVPETVTGGAGVRIQVILAPTLPAAAAI